MKNKILLFFFIAMALLMLVLAFIYSENVAKAISPMAEFMAKQMLILGG